MKIGIIGQGAIGQYVTGQLTRRGLGPHAILTGDQHSANCGEMKVPVYEAVSAVPFKLDLVVDCAGHSALAEYGSGILSGGTDLVTVSIGALADPGLHKALLEAAESGGAKLHLASGAIGALDCLQAARVGGLDKVTYTGRKPPSGWKASPAEEKLDLDGLREAVCHFTGTARQAAIDYPKNANVAAAVALAGTGFDATEVRLIADPAAVGNVHEINAEGDFGQFCFRINGNALPDNPRSSALAAMSVIAAVEKQRQAVVI